jgi:hypothetical protein
MRRATAVANDDDDAAVDIDARGRPDAAIDAPAAPAGQLLLSEIVLQPSSAEFVEIVNPSAQAIDLANYYVADNGHYFKLPVAVPTVDSADFIVRFPAGASIPAHGVVTVAIDSAANFTATYPGITPRSRSALAHQLEQLFEWECA